jgi:hypothetical protein
MQATLPQAAHRPWRERWFPNGEWVLLLALLAEVGLFSAIGGNFFTIGNFFGWSVSVWNGLLWSR